MVKIKSPLDGVNSVGGLLANYWICWGCCSQIEPRQTKIYYFSIESWLVNWDPYHSLF